MKQMSQKRADQRLAKELKKERKQANKAAEQRGLVQDRKTGQYYNPQEAFDKMMNKPEIMAVFNRLSIR